jgi:hypothetical protein
MARTLWRLRTVIIAAIIVALSLSLVFATIGFFPHPTPQHSSITRSLSQLVPAESGNTPGSTYVLIPLSTTEDFALGVNVTGGAATFCVIKEPGYQDWKGTTPNTYDNFPWNNCIIQENTAKDTLTFTPTSTGNWDVVILNTNPTQVVVMFTPA